MRIKQATKRKLSIERALTLVSIQGKASSSFLYFSPFPAADLPKSLAVEPNGFILTSMEKLRIAKSLFENATKEKTDPASATSKIATGLAYLTEALIDLHGDITEIKDTLKKTRKDISQPSRGKSARGEA